MQSSPGSTAHLFSRELQHQKLLSVLPSAAHLHLDTADLVQTAGDGCQFAWQRLEKVFCASLSCPQPVTAAFSWSDPTPKSCLWLLP